MTSLAEIRSQYPQYSDLSDAQLSDAIHAKFYSDMPKAEFDKQLLEKKQAALEAGRTESLLNPQANERSIPAVLGQSAIKGVANLGDIALGMPENYKRLYEYAKGKIQGQDVEAPRGATPVSNMLLNQGVLKPENEPNTPLLKTADFAIQAAVPSTLFTKARTLPTVARELGENLAQGAIGGGAWCLVFSRDLVQAKKLVQRKNCLSRFGTHCLRSLILVYRTVVLINLILG